MLYRGTIIAQDTSTLKRAPVMVALYLFLLAELPEFILNQTDTFILSPRAGEVWS